MRHNGILSVIILGVFLAGCAGNHKVLPAHDEVLHYALSYDLTYLRALEAAQRVPGWELEYTEKEKGVIVVRNINFSSPVDEDINTITLWLERMGPKETTLKIAPNSQHVLGGDALLKEIDKYMTRELKS